MKTWALKLCLITTAGLIVGYSIFFVMYLEWRTGYFLSSLALFFTQVLFWAVVCGVLSGIFLSALIIPLEFYVIRQYNQVLSFLFFGAGLLAGVSIPFYILTLL